MNDVRGPRWPLLTALGIVAGFVAVWSPSPAPAAEPNRVQMVDNEPDLTNWHYDPEEITVPAGSTVVWVNRGKEEHTVTSDPGSGEKFDSGYKRTGGTWQRAFARPGRFSYHCAPHPWMKGTVVVLAATSAAARASDAASSTTTTAPAPAATATTFPPSLAAPTTAPADTSTTAPAETTPTSPAEESSDEEGSEESSAAPAASRKRSGGGLAGTLAVVLLPTLGGLALGAKLRGKKS